jgi:catechol 2,3-dioxygenase-like lactoylglutathione lyase family enzyme
MDSNHFGFTKLVVRDLEKSAAFYKSVCGLTEQARVTAEIGGRPISEILFNATGSGAGTFVLLAYLDEPKPAAGELILGFTTTDVAAFVERALAAGGSVAEEPISQPQHGVKVAFVRDVEGHLIEVVELL